MPLVKFSPIFNSQVVDDNGNPANGWKINTYIAGSSTPAVTYTDSSGTVAQSNPIIVNSLGFTQNGQIWLASGITYKFVLTDASNVVKKTIDNISGVNDSGISISQWQSSGVAPTYISARSFSLAGDQTSDFHIGRRLQFTTTAGTVYGVITASVFTTLTTLTIQMEGVSILDSGLSVVNLSILRADHPATPANSGLQSFRNKIINGGFQINQRIVSGTVTLAAGIYGHDRWKAGAAGCTYTFVTVNNVTTITISAGSLLQIIEGNNLQSGLHVLSWSGTAQGKIDAGAFSPTGISGTAIGGTNLTVEFNTGTLSFIQFELGSTSTLFEARQFGIELTLCQRYLPSINTTTANEAIGLGQAIGTTAAIIPISFNVPTRVPITGITVSTVGNFRLSDAGFNPITVTNIVISIGGIRMATVQVTIASGVVAGAATVLTAISNSQILFTGCEL